MKTFKLYTLGCKVNQYETQNIREQFLRNGFKEMDNGKIADIYVINTCTVTHRADADSLQYIRRAKRENSKGIIVVTGCLAELDEDGIKKIGCVSLIVKNKDKENILRLLNESNEPNGLNEQNGRGVSSFKNHTRAFLKVQDGCNNSCSYCKVPLVRGRSRSRPINEIIQEAQRLVKNSFKEIVLCGICLGSFGKDLKPQVNLADLITALENIEGLLRIRLSSIEAGDVSDELINKMSTSGKLCRHLHIPMQSGDDEILKKMNRKYCRADYIKLIHKIKKYIPGIAITTDALVGFPGESETNFQNTLDLIKEIAPLKVHIFPYSEREGTYAADNFKHDVNQGIIKERILRLEDVANTCAQEYKKQFFNKTLKVLIEGPCKDNFGFWEGYSDNYIMVMVKSSLNLKNQLIFTRPKDVIKDYVLAQVH